MNILKNEVLEFLANKPKDKYEQFNKAFELYRKSPTKNLGMERRMNSSGFSEDGLKNVLYDLQQMHAISDVAVQTFVPAEIEETTLETSEDQNENLGENLGENLEPEAGLEDNADLATIETKEVSEKLKLREEFAFLNEKDCPDIMHVVVGRKIAAHLRYAMLHAEIVLKSEQEENAPELETLAQEAENAFSENRALYDELNYYKEKGELLGKHPLFFELVAKKEVDLMTNEDMMKFKNSSATYFSRKKTDLEKFAKDLEKTSKIQEAIAQRELKIKLVDARLGIKNE